MFNLFPLLEIDIFWCSVAESIKASNFNFDKSKGGFQQQQKINFERCKSFFKNNFLNHPKNPQKKIWETPIQNDELLI